MFQIGLIYPTISQLFPLQFSDNVFSLAGWKNALHRKKTRNGNNYATLGQRGRLEKGKPNEKKAQMVFES